MLSRTVPKLLYKFLYEESVFVVCCVSSVSGTYLYAIAVCCCCCCSSAAHYSFAADVVVHVVVLRRWLFCRCHCAARVLLVQVQLYCKCSCAATLVVMPLAYTAILTTVT